jgi:hypothetical protein
MAPNKANVCDVRDKGIKEKEVIEIRLSAIEPVDMKEVKIKEHQDEQHQQVEKEKGPLKNFVLEKSVNKNN